METWRLYIAMSDKSRLNLFRYHMLATNDSGAVLFLVFLYFYEHFFIIISFIFILYFLYIFYYYCIDETCNSICSL